MTQEEWPHPYADVRRDGTTLIATLVHGLGDGVRDAGRLRAASRKLAPCECASLAALHDVVIEPIHGRIVITTNGCPGESADRLRAAGPLPIARVVRIVAAVIDALRAAHAVGVLHRALSLASIVIDGDDVRVLDFGLGDLLAPDSPHADLRLFALTPERIFGLPAAVTEDVYLLGSVAYHLLSGAPPLVDDDAARLRRRHAIEDPPQLPRTGESAVPSPLASVVERCLAKESDDRFSDMSALAEAWGKAASTAGFDVAKPTAAAKPTPSPPPLPRAAKPRVPAPPLVGPAPPPTPTAAPTPAPTRAPPDEAPRAAVVAVPSPPAESPPQVAVTAVVVVPTSDTPRVGATPLAPAASTGWRRPALVGATALVAILAIAVAMPGDAEVDERRPIVEHEPTPAQKHDDATLPAAPTTVAPAPQPLVEKSSPVPDSPAAVSAEPRAIVATPTLIDAAPPAIDDVALADPDADVGPESTVVASAEVAEVLRQAVASRRAGRTREGLALYRQALELEPENAEALSAIARIHFDRGAFADAVTWGKRVVDAAPTSARGRLALGDAYFKLGRLAEAAAQYRKADKLGHRLAESRLAAVRSPP